MKVIMKRQLANKKGSALSFVLILGLILMLMVASLLAVANSGLISTQESVESRQGYIDAKSVIEFGKIEINKRMSELKAKDEAIKKETNPNQLTILKNQRNTLIAALSNPFNVYGTIDSSGENLISDSLALSAGQYNGVDRQELGVCTVAVTALNASSNKYTFNIKTQNLRRPLDYKVDFDYVVTAFSNWTQTTYVPATMPTTDDWRKTDISLQRNIWGNYVPSIKVDGYNRITDSLLNANFNANFSNLNLDIGKDDASGNSGFQWLNNRTLNLTASKICLTDKPPLKQSDGASFGTNTVFNMTAGQIVIPGDLVIGDNVTLKLTCNKLWVEGNIIMGNNSKFKVIGSASGDNKKEMVVEGEIRTNDPVILADLSDISITALDYFQCKGLKIYNNDLSTSIAKGFELQAKTAVIKGDILIDGPGWTDVMSTQISRPVIFKTEYFDCSGKTTIKNIGNPSTPVVFTQYASGATLNVRFAGGYDQRLSHVDIDNAQKVVFGTSFYLQSNGFDDFSKICWSHLYIMGNNVYLEGATSDSIQMSYNSLIYDDYNNNNVINLYNQAGIKYLDKKDLPVVAAGSYTGKPNQEWYWKNDNGTSTAYLFGRYIRDDLKRSGDYPANSTSGVSGTGAETYY